VPAERGHFALFQKSLAQEARCASALLIPECRLSGLVPFPWQPAQQEGRADLFSSSRKVTLPNKVWVVTNLGCEYFYLSWGGMVPSLQSA